VPQWSPATLALLDQLRPVERMFAQWVAAGLTSTAALRRAAGRTTRGLAQSANRMRRRPDLRAAIDACLKDASVGPRVSRAWLMDRLLIALGKAESAPGPRAAATTVRCVTLLARLQGDMELDDRLDNLPVPSPKPVAGGSEPPPRPANATVPERWFKPQATGPWFGVGEVGGRHVAGPI
jgi:hypothetical protein